MRNVVKPMTLALVAVVFGPLALAAPGVVFAGGEAAVPAGDFVVLLKGIYRPVAAGPDLGLSQVDLDDGAYSRCDIYRVKGLPGDTNQAVGKFYVDFDVTRCAYLLPGGTFTAIVEGFLYEFIEIDGQLYQVGTVELTIPEATGIYRPFIGGSIHMEFITHIIDDETFDEFCLCYISR